LGAIDSTIGTVLHLLLHLLLLHLLLSLHPHNLILPLYTREDILCLNQFRVVVRDAFALHPLVFLWSVSKQWDTTWFV